MKLFEEQVKANEVQDQERKKEEKLKARRAGRRNNKQLQELTERILGLFEVGVYKGGGQ